MTLRDTADELLERIRTTGRPVYDGDGRFFLVADGGTAGQARTDEDARVLAGGLMALYQRCTHLGCRVSFCESSGWFECPCHQGKFTAAGEYAYGVPPRGLDRFAVAVDARGSLTVDTGTVIPGPPRRAGGQAERPDGPLCVPDIVISEPGIAPSRTPSP